MVYQTAFLVHFLPISSPADENIPQFCFYYLFGVNNSALLFPVSHGILFIRSSSSSLQSTVLSLFFFICGGSLTLILSAQLSSYFSLPLWHFQITFPYRLHWDSDLLPFWLLAQFSASKKLSKFLFGKFLESLLSSFPRDAWSFQAFYCEALYLGGFLLISHRSVFHLIPLVWWLTFARITSFLFSSLLSRCFSIDLFIFCHSAVPLPCLSLAE